MTRRHYQLFALTLLLGAPVLVSVLSNMIPALHDLMPLPSRPGLDPAPAQEQNVASSESADTQDMTASFPATQPPPGTAPIDGSFSAAPSLDPSGMAVDPVGLEGDASAAAPALDLGGDGGGLSEEQMIAQSPGVVIGPRAF